MSIVVRLPRKIQLSSKEYLVVGGWKKLFSTQQLSGRSRNLLILLNLAWIRIKHRSAFLTLLTKMVYYACNTSFSGSFTTQRPTMKEQEDFEKFDGECGLVSCGRQTLTGSTGSTGSTRQLSTS